MQRQSISIGPGRSIELLDIDYQNGSILEVDNYIESFTNEVLLKFATAKDPLSQFWNKTEECLAACCGIMAFDLWPDSIAKAAKELDRQALMQQLSELKKNLQESSETIVSYHRLNQNFAKSSFSQLIEYLITEIEKLDNPLVDFKYIDQPELFVGLQHEETTCDVCQRQKRCYDAEAFYGEEQISSICPECLTTGQLYDRDIYTCQGDLAELKRQLREINPSLSKADLDDMAELKTIELEKTTPHLPTWQDWNWPCADGDYCRFIGYGSKPFYALMAPDGNARSLFKKSLYYTLADNTNADELWQKMPRKTINNYADSNEYSTLFYVFKSLHSDRIITIWDSN